MNISEQVLYSTLAQIAKKDFNNLKKKPVKEFEPISIVKSDKKKSQVNKLYELEKDTNIEKEQEENDCKIKEEIQKRKIKKKQKL